jgi:hypothetical protein
VISQPFRDPHSSVLSLVIGNFVDAFLEPRCSSGCFERQAVLDTRWADRFEQHAGDSVDRYPVFIGGCDVDLGDDEPARVELAQAGGSPTWSGFFVELVNVSVPHRLRLVLACLFHLIAPFST